MKRSLWIQSIIVILGFAFSFYGKKLLSQATEASI